MAKLPKGAVKAFGKAKYPITDQGGEFRVATARLERFWRSLKQIARLNILLPLTIDDLERKLEATLTSYLCLRPHRGLEGPTPAEAFLAIEAACRRAVSPPRARKGEEPLETPFTIGFLDPDKRAFPILKKAA